MAGTRPPLTRFISLPHDSFGGFGPPAPSFATDGSFAQAAALRSDSLAAAASAEAQARALAACADDVALWRRVTQHNDADAAHSLGLRASARGDAPAAAALFRRAAVSGHAEGTCCLASALHSGVGVHADPAESAQWFARAAQGGSAQAANGLGVILFEQFEFTACPILTLTPP